MNVEVAANRVKELSVLLHHYNYLYYVKNESAVSILSTLNIRFLHTDRSKEVFSHFYEILNFRMIHTCNVLG